MPLISQCSLVQSEQHNSEMHATYGERAVIYSGLRAHTATPDS